MFGVDGVVFVWVVFVWCRGVEVQRKDEGVSGWTVLEAELGNTPEVSVIRSHPSARTSSTINTGPASLHQKPKPGMPVWAAPCHNHKRGVIVWKALSLRNYVAQ